MNKVMFANILMIVGEGILFIGSSRKNKKELLLFQIVSMIVMGLASYLLKAYSAIVMDVVGITRNILSINNISSRKLSYLFIASAIVFGILFNSNSFWGYLPIIANVTQSVFILDSRSSINQIRLACAFSSLCWTIFNIAVKGYSGAVFNLINALSYLYHVFKKERTETK